MFIVFFKYVHLFVNMLDIHPAFPVLDPLTIHCQLL